MSKKDRKLAEARKDKLNKLSLDAIHKKKVSAPTATERDVDQTKKSAQKKKMGAKKQHLVRHPGIDGIGRQTLKRLSLRGGAKRISSLAYFYLRRSQLAFYDKMVDYALAYTKSAGRKTITERDVCNALDKMGHTIIGDPRMLPSHGGRGKNASREKDDTAKEEEVGKDV